MDEENSLNLGLNTFNYVNLEEILLQDALWHNFQDVSLPFTTNEVNLANSNIDETIKNENSLNKDYFGEYDPSHVFTASTSTAQIQDVPNTPSFTTEIPKNPSQDVNCNFSSIPASLNWPGQFNFNITFGSQKKNTKGVSWTYSDVMNKLYVRKDASCPIKFSVNTSLPAGVFMRALALYSASEHMSEVVHRCANHSTEEQKKGVLEAEHLIRCESNMASYQVDEFSGRHSVVVPFDNPPAGQEFSTYLYKFTCFGSCAGGPNRRPLMVVFTLEQQGQVIGRRRLDVKICACPGRDKKFEEMSCMISENNKESTEEPSSAFETDEYLAHTEKLANYPPAKKAKMSSDEESIYTIAVDDYDCYLFLKLMKHLYDLNILSPERLRNLDSCSQGMK